MTRALREPTERHDRAYRADVTVPLKLRDGAQIVARTGQLYTPLRGGVSVITVTSATTTHAKRSSKVCCTVRKIWTPHEGADVIVRLDTAACGGNRLDEAKNSRHRSCFAPNPRADRSGERGCGIAGSLTAFSRPHNLCESQ
jgi:hypothetical protein